MSEDAVRTVAADAAAAQRCQTADSVTQDLPEPTPALSRIANDLTPLARQHNVPRSALLAILQALAVRELLCGDVVALPGEIAAALTAARLQVVRR